MDVPFPVQLRLVLQVLPFILPDVVHSNLCTEVSEHLVLHLGKEPKKAVNTPITDIQH